MKVLLLKDVEKLGKYGDAIEVKDGYARNYLIPRGIALAANENNFKKLEKIKKEKEKIEEKNVDKFLSLKEKIEKVSVTIVAEVKEDEEIYGSVSEVQILKSLKEEGIELEHNKIVVEEPIKKLGVYNLKVKIYKDIEATLRVWVVKK